jgi:hypothetical protein
MVLSEMLHSAKSKRPGTIMTAFEQQSLNCPTNFLLTRPSTAFSFVLATREFALVIIKNSFACLIHQGLKNELK